MDSRIFEIDPQAGIAYGMYNALKKEEGSFEDFLLHYNSHEANEGDNGWLTKMMQSSISQSLSSSEVMSAMSQLGVKEFDFLSSLDFFETQAYAYRQKLLQEMHKRGQTEVSMLSDYSIPKKITVK